MGRSQIVRDLSSGVLLSPSMPFELLGSKEHFQKAFGRSAMDFVREVRLRGAAKLLRQTHEPTKTIAARMGYASRSNFSHAFTEFFGVAPAEYRAGE